MKTKLILASFTISLGLLFLFASCQKESNRRDKKSSFSNINTNDTILPMDPNSLTETLVVANGQIVEGEMPSPTNTPESPDLMMVDSTISYSSGSEVKLPVVFQDNSGNGISGIRFQVNGASKHYDLPIAAAKSGSVLLPIGIPADVNNGRFCITVTVYDGSGNVSNTFETCITVTSPMSCDTERVSGGEGITSTLHSMEGNTGVVIIEYETYTVPDRIDVYYNGFWVAGTGTDPGSQGVPPLADCSNPTEGYIGDNGTFCFSFDPGSISKRVSKILKSKSTSTAQVDLGLASEDYVEVVVSGCVRGGTAWKYQISCADPTIDCAQGQEGSPRFSLQFDGSVDFDLHVKDPNGEEIYYSNPSSASGGTLDVDCVCCPEGDENIFWVSGTAPTGQYEYWIHFYGACDDQSANYTLNVSSNGNILDTKTGTLSTVDGESQHWTYIHQ